MLLFCTKIDLFFSNCMCMHLLVCMCIMFLKVTGEVGRGRLCESTVVNLLHQLPEDLEAVDEQPCPASRPLCPTLRDFAHFTQVFS